MLQQYVSKASQVPMREDEKTLDLLARPSRACDVIDLGGSSQILSGLLQCTAKRQGINSDEIFKKAPAD